MQTFDIPRYAFIFNAAEVAVILKALDLAQRSFSPAEQAADPGYYILDAMAAQSAKEPRQ